MRLVAGGTVAVVDPNHGGRLSSLTAEGEGLVATQDSPGGVRHGSLDWGIYPLAPFAGRIRNGRFTFHGREHALPTRAHPHAIHGTVDDVPWAVTDADDSSVTMTCDLGRDWPFGGMVEHRIALSPDGVDFRLSLRADETMPAQVGWHPWFRRPAEIRADFDSWHPRDGDGMPLAATGKAIPDLSGPVDDCFVATAAPVQVMVDGMALRLESDCSHWVVYTDADHGVCVEPQSGPPNEVESGPFVLEAGATLTRWFRIGLRGRA